MNAVLPLVIVERPTVPLRVRLRIRFRIRPVRAGLALALLALGALLAAQPLQVVVAVAG